MSLFLKARAWQIFLLSFGIPCVLAVVAGILTRADKGPDSLFLPLVPAMALFVGVSVAWYWTLGRLLNRSIRKDARPDDRWFRRGLMYVSVYVAIFLGLWEACALALRMGYLPATTARFGLVFAGVVFLTCLHLLAMAAMVYILYFLSKNMAVVARETGTSTGQSTSGNFLLLWFFPIGVWFIQPLMNRIWREQRP